jgi:sigma-B regulation protein RsbU (phosphoserine phosphatase)
MTPATEMSGDFYDLFPIDDHRLGLVVADVSGKGVPAAFFMAVARTELHSIAQEGGAPGQVLARVNDALCDENPLHLFVTVFYAVLDIGSGRFQYANGGHNPPVRMRGTEVSALDTTGGMALGLFPGVAFRDTSLELAPGDGIFMYTDGVTEAFDTAGREFGEARLHQSLGEADLQDAEQLVRSVLTAVTEFASGARQSDDITCLAVRFLEPLANHDSA